MSADTESTRTDPAWYVLAFLVLFFAAGALLARSTDTEATLPPHFLNAPCSLSHGHYVTCTVNNEAKVTGPSIFDVKLITWVEALPSNRLPSVFIQECKSDKTDCKKAFVNTKSNIEAVALTKQIQEWQKKYGEK